MVYTPRNLRFLIDVVGADRVIFGTDWPAPMTFDDPVGRLERMKELQTEADGLIEEADSADLSGDKAELVETAKQHYEWHNYLDAVRFLKAALEDN